MDRWWKRKLTWSRKITEKETLSKTYRLISCLPIIREEIYYSLLCRGVFPEEQKWYHRRTTGTGDLLYIYQHILNDCKVRWRNLAMAWIDYKKAYDVVSQTWIIDFLKMYKISDKVIKVISEAMKSWDKNLTKAKIQSGTFQGDVLSPILFVILVMPLNYILKNAWRKNHKKD